jgi:hypothetical protein
MDLLDAVMEVKVVEMVLRRMSRYSKFRQPKQTEAGVSVLLVRLVNGSHLLGNKAEGDLSIAAVEGRRVSRREGGREGGGEEGERTGGG